MASSVEVIFDMSSVAKKLDALKETIRTQVRPAAQAGAEVIYREVKAKAPAHEGVHFNRKGDLIPPGKLKASIYHAFSANNSFPFGDNPAYDRATYHISWNHKKAPHGHLVEFGHTMTRKRYIGSNGRWYTSKTKLQTPKHVPARPFLRPAYDATVNDALDAARLRMAEGLR